VLAAAACVGSTLGVVPSSLPSAAAPVTRLTQAIELVTQQLDVAADGGISVTVTLPTTVVAAVTDGSLDRPQLVITSYERIDDVSAFDSIVQAGELPGTIDSVSLPLLPIPAVCPGAAAGSIIATTTALPISVPIETDTKTRDALQMSNPGLVPVTVEVRERNNDEPVAALVTFVHRLPAADNETTPPLGVTVAMGPTGNVLLGDTADPSAIVITDDTRAELRRLVRALDASTVPATVSVPAGLIADLDADDPELADELMAALDGHTLVATPRWPLDPAAAAEAGQQQLYGDWLRRGEDAAGDAGVTTTRAATVLNGPISGASAVLLRNLGTRLLLLGADRLDEIAGDSRADIATTGTIELTTAGEPTLQALVTDRRSAAYLAGDTATSSPYLDTIYAVAGMLAQRAELLNDGSDPAEHTVLIGTADASVPDADRLQALTEMVTTTSALDVVGLDTVVDRTDRNAVGGAVELPERAALDASQQLLERIDEANLLRLEAAAVTSVLMAGDDRSARWTDGLNVFPSTAFSDAQIRERATELRREFAAIFANIQLPAGYSFNLAGPETEIRIRLTNLDSRPVRVRVRMSSNKLLFPKGDQIEELPANSVTEIVVPVVTRSGGKFPVGLEVFTPTAENVRIGPTVILTANVNALNGRGTTVSRVALVLLAIWWIRHAWRTRRKKRHDAAEAQPDERSPAVATTLPDS
jgi:hypothetical protein